MESEALAESFRFPYQFQLVACLLRGPLIVLKYFN